ncbi:SMI1/KNR4 family protein [Terrimonas sp. NA20]|uniref:SMI1/KNR4 family protein n=1 Tax=Terrimonas ginsenosidimutans TaxID=2908004 RepID=A0ABS9KZB9_9BACT|nr:SMI1/KNR4 family protein [Terrimonas ginsenosidimutans]MCG2617691.1 SMI1/KNR4 family protein [Terrimonas ginsenosidimutans]
MLDSKIQNLKNALSEVAPRIVTLSLNQGASDDEIEVLQSLTGKSLPDDLKQLYKSINGNIQEENWGNFFYGLTFYSISESIDELNSRKDFSEQHDAVKLKYSDAQIDGSDLYNPNWIPVATDGSRDRLFVDMAPSDSGTPGQIIYIEGTDLAGILVAESIEKLLEQFTNDLKEGRYHLAEDALEDGNHWLETEDSITLYKLAQGKIYN